MNIFALSDDPSLAAHYQCNKHVGKMFLEGVQLLCTYLAQNIIKQEFLPYKATHVNHPCSKWLRESHENVAWLYMHVLTLNDEFKRRFGKKHKTMTALCAIEKYLPDCGWSYHTPFALAMPDEWKNEDKVLAYRCYYIAEKSRFAKWAPRVEPPHWWPFAEEVK